jgi:hypothetical protein
MPKLIDDFEKLLENTLEDGLFSWLPSNTSLSSTLYQILNLVSNEIEYPSVRSGEFLIQVARHDYSTWFSNQVDLVSFSHSVVAACNQVGISLPRPPAFHIMAVDNLEPGTVVVSTVAPSEHEDETQFLQKVDSRKSRFDRIDDSSQEFHAYLTDTNNEIYQLTKPVTNIGRREDNDVVLGGQQVSRQHAQIRRIHQHYMIFDLNSTGGTWVNNIRVTQAQLESGDVIAFADNILIFAEELAPITEEETNDLNGTTSAPAPRRVDHEEGGHL